MTKDFKVGDKVKILDTNGIDGVHKVGDIKTIVCMDGNGGYWLDGGNNRGEDCECGDHHWVFRKAHLELAGYVPATKNEPYQFKTIKGK